MTWRQQALTTSRTVCCSRRGCDPECAPADVIVWSIRWNSKESNIAQALVRIRSHQLQWQQSTSLWSSRAKCLMVSPLCPGLWCCGDTLEVLVTAQSDQRHVPARKSHPPAGCVMTRTEASDTQFRLTCSRQLLPRLRSSTVVWRSPPPHLNLAVSGKSTAALLESGRDLWSCGSPAGWVRGRQFLCLQSGMKVWNTLLPKCQGSHLAPCETKCCSLVCLSLFSFLFFFCFQPISLDWSYC